MLLVYQVFGLWHYFYYVETACMLYLKVVSLYMLLCLCSYQRIAWNYMINLRDCSI